jgi:hypothetical protein
MDNVRPTMTAIAPTPCQALRYDFKIISLRTNIDIQPLACQLAQKCAEFS